jgi:hypothetical protein
MSACPYPQTLFANAKGRTSNANRLVTPAKLAEE